MKLALIAVMLVSTSAFARDVKPDPVRKAPRPPPAKNIVIGPLALNGKLHILEILELLERANNVLERSALERKSFLPKIVSSLDEEAL